MFYFVAILCVICIAVGQILFKITASSLATTGSFFSAKTLSLLFLALFIYGLTTIAWIWVLQKIELVKAYPLMALAFAIVPVGSYFLLGERFTTQYVIGVMLIVAGIIITVKS